MTNTVIVNKIDPNKVWRNYKIGFFLILIISLGAISGISKLPELNAEDTAGSLIAALIILPISSILIAILTAWSSYRISGNKTSILKGLFGLWPFPFPIGLFFSFFATMYEHRKSVERPFSKFSLLIFWGIFLFSVILVVDTILSPSQLGINTLLGI